MSSELTPELGLFKAVPGSGEPFRTTDLNDNADLIDSAFVDDRAAIGVVAGDLASVDGRVTAVEADNVSQWGEINTAISLASNAGARLDVVEFDGWVTSDRIAAGAVNGSKIEDGSIGEGELTPYLNLTGHSVDVPTAASTDSSPKAASTSFVQTVVAGSAADTRVTAYGYTDSRVGELLISKDFSGAAPVLSAGNITTISNAEYQNLKIEIRVTTAGSLSPSLSFYSGSTGAVGPATVDTLSRTFGVTTIGSSSGTTFSFGSTPGTYHSYVLEILGNNAGVPNTSTPFSRIGYSSSYGVVKDVRISGIARITKIVFSGTWTGSAGTVNIYGWN